MIEHLGIFDAWEPIAKARKPKGLKNWGRLSHIAHKLDGKKSSDITFTTAYPGKEGQKKVLGSIEGNLHFLMGYGNPGFHLAVYHWQIVDPNLTDEEAEELHQLRGHPSRPELWKRAELEDNPEGDLEMGMPHPSAIVAQEKARRQSEGIRVVVGGGTYLAVPSEGLVFGEHNRHVYKWDLLRNSFLAAMNPSLVEAMDGLDEEVEVEKSGPSVPDMVRHHVSSAESFADDVYPLVKSLYPVPGSIVPLDTHTGETIYGVVQKSSIDFFDRRGYSVAIQAWDKSYTSLDLSKAGAVHASMVYNFGREYLGLEVEQTETLQQVHELPMLVKGEATPGWENVSGEYSEDLRKSVEFDEGSYRVVLTNG
jgi:hypothetical protein